MSAQLNIVSKDILTVTEGIIAHQANCKGAMGKGLALQIKNTYPKVYEDYRRDYFAKRLVLGSVSYSRVGENLWIANLMAQDHYRGAPPLTDYLALVKCLRQANEFASGLNLPLYLPYGIGCGLAGGDWEVVSRLIARETPNAIVCRLNWQRSDLVV